ncbi:hypothetical protein [Pseudobutyrivibrio xylanivorans]|uniref:Alcohol acetyltransferase n=1 Tax=Pseudobutyrivibrio xylanivorans TaxID=185007 RepID=A0A5P6VPI1_PSEXY|nr:hypothetical protein [Pseudobutyrivibrio xylanivorans]QFJ54576.1 hypothetical protein FXF36_06780 [Pseudobutyrivibrio xylanivorans]
MGRENWYKVDNVAKVFLATAAKRDTRTLRVSCTLWEPIDPGLLQFAVLSAIQERPQFQVRIRRGIFWHYMEDTDLQPIVEEEHGRVCPSLYHPGHMLLHYKVTYFGNRINLDLFHAISDGTGALEFLNIIVLDYLKLKYPDKFGDLTIHSGASEDDLNQDSYKQFFGSMHLKASSLKRAYHPGGLKLPYDQLQFFEVQIPTEDILPKAKEVGVGLTSYIGAKLMMAIKADMPPRKMKTPVNVSMPVNLRNYYPSSTSRNFFNNVNVTHVFDEEISFEDLAKEFDLKLKENLTEENIKQQMDNFETMEYFIPVRAVPLFIKQMVVRYGSKVTDKKVSVVLSNLGVQRLPQEIGSMVKNYCGFCSSSNLFVVMSSYNGVLTLGITSPYSNTKVVKTLVRGFSEDGMRITAYATEVIR